MSAAPSGTKTFLFTDIEGSTRLVQRLGDGFGDVLEEHRSLLRSCFAAHGGREISTKGDSFFVVFTDPAQAVAAALAAQEALAAHPWPPEAELRVRMGVHTGHATFVDGDWVGLAVHQAARICVAAHGGQVVVSAATRSRLDSLPPAVTLRPLGRHRLKDLDEPQALFQLCHPHLRQAFPPLRTLSVLPNNLPAQLTSFVGREREMREVEKLLSAGFRIVSLVGPGGCGKTRLALHVAADVAAAYPDGVWLAELAGIAADALVPQAVASALQVQEEPGRELTQALVARLRSSRLLLVLDNCEHVVAGAAALAESLVRACPNVHVLATSRESLCIDGEVSWGIRPLTLPDPEEPLGVEQLGRSEAVRLFLDRAALARPGFTMDEGNAAVVASICRRLDGIPLAIELAAARVQALSVTQIDERLDDRFRFLTAGRRTALPRQQTLRALVDWSYGLLDDAERALFCRLSVFADGFTLDAAEAVAGPGPGAEEDVVELLSRLVRKSLVLADDVGGSARFRMLETIRRYGLERLEESGAGPDARRRQRRWCVALAERVEPEDMGGAGPAWHDQLEVEYANVRAVVESALDDPDGVEDALRICGALGFFLWWRGHVSEGRAWVETALARSEGAPPALRAKALLVLGTLAFAHVDLATSIPALAESVALAARTGQELVAIRASSLLGVSLARQGELGEGTDHLRRALALAERSGRVDQAGTHYYLGSISAMQGDREGARRHLEAAIALGREHRAAYVLVRCLPVAARDALASGDTATARRLLTEALDAARAASHDQVSVARLLAFLGEASVAQGDLAAAQAHLDEAARIVARKVDDPALTAKVELAVGTLARHQGDLEAARLHLGRSLAAAVRLGRDKELVDAHLALGALALAAGDTAQAVASLEHALVLARTRNHTARLHRALVLLGEAWLAAGRPGRARPLLEEARCLCEALGTDEHRASWQHAWALLDLAEGNPGRASALLGEALATRARLGRRPAAVESVEALARARVRLGDARGAAFLLGAATGQRVALVGPTAPGPDEGVVEEVRLALAPAAFDQQWSRGRSAALDEVVREVRAEPTDVTIDVATGTDPLPPVAVRAARTA